MKLSSILDKRLIFLDYHCDSYGEIIDTIVAKFSSIAGIGEDEIRSAIVRREHHGTMYIGHRLLLPHGYIDGVPQVMVLFMRLDKELSVIIEERRRSIKYVFAVITSKQKAQIYLKVLKTIANVVTHYTHILENAKSARDLLLDLDKKAVEVDDTVTARELISCDVSVRQNDSVLLAVRRMESSGVTILPVVDKNGRLTGIVDLADLFTATFPERMVDPESLWLLYDMGAGRDRLLEPVKRQWEKEKDSPVSLVMKSGEQHCIDADAQYFNIVNHLTEKRHRYVIVLDADKSALGLIDSEDLVRRMIKA
jgi:mannitol/fructose-specific phosphotransferase system IIA component (Ntr-type)